MDDVRPRPPRPHIHREAPAGGHHARLEVDGDVDVIPCAALRHEIVHDALVGLFRAANVGEHLHTQLLTRAAESTGKGIRDSPNRVQRGATLEVARGHHRPVLEILDHLEQLLPFLSLVVLPRPLRATALSEGRPIRLIAVAGKPTSAHDRLVYKRLCGVSEGGLSGQRLRQRAVEAQRAVEVSAGHGAISPGGDQGTAAV
mmetsp:Transcript_42274/g.75855  ORF Transcript_42274/g.75855 Transcript_42274/m.75855 type:complete len:201 (-) Transcript_42274:653-1255(-)